MDGALQEGMCVDSCAAVGKVQTNLEQMSLKQICVCVTLVPRAYAKRKTACLSSHLHIVCVVCLSERCRKVL